ncbi:sugar phosphate isomerase/epimerase family protein [Pseudomonas alabamensis]|uniref:sugar phosphate isomerase/epimerase family protein n=1 Tax=Pseudomonas alabamensis TaxID=3064349 RepID=UPI003F64F425
MQRLSISQITTQPLSIEDDLQLCRRLGCALELAEKKLSTDPQQARDQLAMIKDSGVRITSIQPRILTLYPTQSAPEPQAPEARLDALMGTVELFAGFWQDVPLVTNTGADAEGNEARVWDGCLERYPTLARHAQAHGLKIALEALGPSLMNRNSILFAFSQARELAAQVDHPAFGVCLDLYNSWQDPGLVETISADKLFLVQLADWRRPRSLHDRRALGEGAIPLSGLLGAIVACGYAGDYVLEIFSEAVSDSLWADKATVVQAVEASKGTFDALAMAMDRRAQS